MSGCVSLGKLILMPVGLLLVGALGVALLGRFPICTVPANVMLTSQTASALQRGIDRFQEFRDQLPLPSSGLNHSSRMRIEGAWLTELLRLYDAENMPLPMARKGRGGLVQASGGWTLTDAWGQPYYLMSSDAAGLPENDPAVIAKVSETPHPKPKVLVYSAGPDGDPATWRDNIKNW